MKHQEDILQEECVAWFRIQYPKKLIFAVPNGGRRNLLEAVRLKRQGVTKGVSDLVIPEPSKGHHGLFIELKVKPNKPTKEQVEFLEEVKKRGYRAEVAYAFDEFRATCKDYL